MLDQLFRSTIEVTLSMSVCIAVLLLLSRWTKRRYAAKWRYWVWLALAVRLLLPVNVSLPQAPISLQTPGQQMMLYVQETPAEEQRTAQYEIPAENRTESTDGVLPESTIKEMDFIRILAFIWAGGVCAFLFYHCAAQIVFFHRLGRWKHPAREREAQCRFEEIARELSVEGKVRLQVCELQVGPMLTGLFHPVLLLPKRIYTSEEYTAIFTHELTHAKRHDLWYKTAMLFANAIHWFNPFVWRMAREAERDMELSCDDAVLRQRGASFAGSYGKTILAAVQQEIRTPGTLSTSFRASAKELKERLANLFDDAPKCPGRAALALVLAAVLFGSAFVACGPVAQGDDSSPPIENAAELLEYRTDFVGDNAKVGNVLTLLGMPDGVRYDGFSLQTGAEPYGITINCTLESEEAFVSGTGDESMFDDAPFFRKAAILFSLVGNVEDVTFQLQYSSDLAMTFAYTRNEAEALFSGNDLREYAKDETAFKDFLRQVEKVAPIRNKEEYRAAFEQLQQQTSAAMTIYANSGRQSVDKTTEAAEEYINACRHFAQIVPPEECAPAHDQLRVACDEMATVYQSLLDAIHAADEKTHDNHLKSGLAAVQSAEEHFEEGKELLDQLFE